jgi:hypothetical protein
MVPCTVHFIFSFPSSTPVLNDNAQLMHDSTLMAALLLGVFEVYTLDILWEPEIFSHIHAYVDG